MLTLSYELYCYIFLILILTYMLMMMMIVIVDVLCTADLCDSTIFDEPI